MRRAPRLPLASINARLQGGVGLWVGLSVLFSLLAVIQTWPLVLQMSDSIMDAPAQPGDTWYYLWNLWWVKHALVDLHTNPYVTDFLLFPGGADLHFEIAAVNGILSIPFQVVTKNVILSWNVLALAFIALSGLGMYAVSYRVNRNRAAALLSAYIFAFAPVTIMRLQGGEWNVSTTWLIPPFILFLLRFQETGRIREAVAAGICWSLITYNWLEFGVDAALFLALFLAYWSFVYLLKGERGRTFGLWRGAAVIVGVWFAVSTPLLIPTLQIVANQEIFLPAGDDFWSADLLTYVTPSPLWGPGTMPDFPSVQHNSPGGIEGTAYLGIAPLLLAGVAMFAVRRTPHRVLLWAAAFLLFATLALGPNLWIGGDKTFSIFGLSFSVPLPYQIYDQLPVAGERRVTERMIVFGIVGLSVLAGTGLDVIMSWLKPRLRPIVPLVALLALSFVALEYWNPPVHLSQLSNPAVFDDIRGESGDFTVLHVPLGQANGYTSTGNPLGGALTNYYQTLHGKPSIGGYVSRTTIGANVQQPGLRYLACPHCEIRFQRDDLDGRLVREVFEENRIKYVVLHALTPQGNPIPFTTASILEEMDAYLSNVVGLVPIFADSTLTVYRNEEIE